MTSKKYIVEEVECSGKELRPLLEKMHLLLAKHPRHIAVVSCLTMAILLEAPELDDEALPGIVMDLSQFLITILTGMEFEDDDKLTLN